MSARQMTSREIAGDLIYSVFRAQDDRRFGQLQDKIETLVRALREAEAKFHAETRARSLQCQAIREAVRMAFIMNDIHRERINAALDASYNVEPVTPSPLTSEEDK